MIDIASDEEQRRLVQRMRQQQRAHSHRSTFAWHAHQRHQGAQRGHRRPGQDALEVALAQRQHHAPGGGDRTRALQQHLPQQPVVEAGVQPRQQVHTQLHHRGRMQVGRHRCWRGHRVGKPEVERELRALGEGAHDHQQDTRRQQRGGRGGRQAFDDHADGAGAHHLPDQDQARQQRQAAGACHQQRLLRRLAADRAFMVEADEQEGQHAGGFPEQEEREQIVSSDAADHRHHEQRELHEQPPLPRVACEVAACVDEHRAAHTRDHQQHQHRQAVNAPGQRDAQRRYPIERTPQRQRQPQQHAHHDTQRSQRQHREGGTRGQPHAAIGRRAQKRRAHAQRPARRNIVTPSVTMVSGTTNPSIASPKAWTPSWRCAASTR